LANLAVSKICVFQLVGLIGYTSYLSAIRVGSLL
jgi:hypothetical protein